MHSNEEDLVVSRTKRQLPSANRSCQPMVKKNACQCQWHIYATSRHSCAACAFRLTYGHDPVILFMPMENPGDRLARIRRQFEGGIRALFRPRALFWHSAYEPRYTVPTGGISARNVPHSFHRIDLNY